MKLIVNIAGSTLEYEVKDEKEVFQKLGFWQSLPKTCKLCGSDVVLDYRTPKGFSYYILACTGPVRHESTLGVNQTGGTLYYKNGWKEAFGRGYGDEHSDEEPDHSPRPQTNSNEQKQKESLIKRIVEFANRKKVSLTSIALGMSEGKCQQLDGLSIEQLEKALEFIKRK